MSIFFPASNVGAFNLLGDVATDEGYDFGLGGDPGWTDTGYTNDPSLPPAPSAHGRYPRLGPYSRVVPGAVGPFAWAPSMDDGLMGGALTAGAVSAGTEYGRYWTQFRDATDSYGGGIRYHPKPEKTGTMPSGQRMIREWVRAGMGEYVDPNTGKIITMDKALESSERTALNQWGQGSPARSGIIGTLKDFTRHVVNQTRQVQDNDPVTRYRFVETARLNRRGDTMTGRAFTEHDIVRATNLLEFGAYEPAQQKIVEAVSQFMRSHPPAGLDGAKPEERVKAFLNMLAAAFSEDDTTAGGVDQVRQMLLQLEDEVIARVGSPTLPALTDERVHTELSAKGYSVENMNAIAAALRDSVAAGRMRQGDAWYILKTARSVSEDNKQGALPIETANRLALDLLLDIRLTDGGHRFSAESRDPSDRRRRLLQAIPLRAGKPQWTDWKYLVSELEKGVNLIKNDTAFAQWEGRKTGGGGRIVRTQVPNGPQGPSLAPSPTGPAPNGGGGGPPNPNP